MATTAQQNKLYDVNTDYQSLINAEMKKTNPNKTLINQYNTARNYKIADNPTMSGKWNLNATQQAIGYNQPTLRQYVEGLGTYNLGNEGATPIINGVKIDPAAYGLSNVGGSWTGTEDQYNALLEPLAALNVTPEVIDATGNVNNIGYGNQQQNNINTIIDYIMQQQAEPFNYQQSDLATNAINQAATNTYEAIQQANARRGMSNDKYNMEQAQLQANKAANELGLQYRQQALDEYNAKRTGNLESLNALMGLKSQDLDTIMNIADKVGTLGNKETLAGRGQTLNERAQKQAEKEFTVGVVQLANEQAWERSASNPANQWQMLKNVEQSILNSELPEQVKLTTQKMVNEVAAGKMDINLARQNILNLETERGYTVAQTAYTMQQAANALLEGAGISAQTEGQNLANTATRTGITEMQELMKNLSPDQLKEAIAIMEEQLNE